MSETQAWVWTMMKTERFPLFITKSNSVNQNTGSLFLLLSPNQKIFLTNPRLQRLRTWIWRKLLPMGTRTVKDNSNETFTWKGWGKSWFDKVGPWVLPTGNQGGRTPPRKGEKMSSLLAMDSCFHRLCLQHWASQRSKLSENGIFYTRRKSIESHNEAAWKQVGI